MIEESLDAAGHRHQPIEAFNAIWDLRDGREYGAWFGLDPTG